MKYIKTTLPKQKSTVYKHESNKRYRNRDKLRPFWPPWFVCDFTYLLNISYIIIPQLCHFYHIRVRKRAKYATVLHCAIPVWKLCLLKENVAKPKCSGIINLLFGVLVNNTRGHFTRCFRFSKPRSTTQLAKFLLVLSNKTPNKMYVYFTPIFLG